MTQSNVTPDALSKGSGFLGGLLSQMAGSLGVGGKTDMFSKLLSGENGLEAALDLQAQAGQPKNTTFASASTSTPTSTTQASAQASFATNTDGTSSTADLMQNLRSIVRTLQKIMTGLNQGQQSPAQAKAKTADDGQQNSADDTTAVAESDSSAAVQTVQDTQTTQAAQTTPDDSTDPAKMVADIITELLAMTQLMMQLVAQQAQAGGTATTDAGTQANNQLIASLENVGGAALGQGLLTLAKDLQILNENNRLNVGGDLTTTAQDDTTDTTASTGNVLLDLLKTIEKDALQLWPVPAESSTVQDASAVSTTVTPKLSVDDSKLLSDMTAQFADLDKMLKKVVAGLEQQVQAQVTAGTGVKQAVTQLVQTAQQNAQKTLDDLTAGMGAANAPDPDPKTVASDAVQNRLYPLTAAPAPVSHAHAAAQAQVQAQQNAQTQPQNNNSQSSPTTSASILATAARENATGDTNSDMLSDHQAAFSGSSNAGAENFANEGAQGVQATGTYNFASTLSAFRAANGGSTGLPSVVDQVILQMNRSVKNGNDQLTLQLHPADLGKITVKLDVGSDGKVQGTVTADNAKTLDMLQKDSRSLERALQDAGLRADPGSLQFNLGHQQDQGQAGQTAQGQNGESGQGDGTQNASEELELVDKSSLQEIYYITPSGVNIRV